MKGLLLILWGIWDKIYYLCTRIRFVSKQDNLFRIVRKVYKGPPLQTKSGHLIQSGDEIVKIHIYNYGLAKSLYKLNNDVSMALYIRKKIEESLKGLSEYLSQEPDIHKVKAVIGTSMLNRGAERFGFSLQDVQDTLYYRYKAFIFKLIYLLIHPYGFSYLRKNGNKLKSKHIIMSIEELFELYLERGRYS